MVAYKQTCDLIFSQKTKKEFSMAEIVIATRQAISLNDFSAIRNKAIQAQLLISPQRRV